MKGVIRKMANRGKHRISNPIGVPVVSIAFGVDFKGYPLNGPELWEIADFQQFAGRMWRLGWDYPMFIPQIWGVTCIWGLMDGERLGEDMQNEMAKGGTSRRGAARQLLQLPRPNRSPGAGQEALGRPVFAAGYPC